MHWNQFVTVLFFFLSRARELRKSMVRNHIETLLNLRGKTLPSAEEEIPRGQREEAVAVWETLDHETYPVTLPSIEVENEEGVGGEEEEEGSKVEPFLFSDYTEKMQSMIPQCELTVIVLTPFTIVTLTQIMIKILTINE